MINDNNSSNAFTNDSDLYHESGIRIVGYVHRAQIEREEILKQFSDSDYNDDKWIITKGYEGKNYTDSERTIRFRKGLEYGIKTELKNATIELLCQQHLDSVKSTIEYVESTVLKYCPKLQFLRSMQPWYIMRIGETIRQTSVKPDSKWLIWRALIKVFQILGLPEQYAAAYSFDMPRRNDTRYDNKIIPDEAVKKLDLIFTQENIPSSFRLVYWTFRLFPNRLREVLSIKRNCLSQYTEDTFIFRIPTFKQVPQIGGDTKLIAIKNEGMGEIYLGLLKEQLSFIEGKSFDNDYLFNIQNYWITRCNKDPEHIFSKADEIVLLNQNKIYKIFDKVCSFYEIKDNDGGILHLGTHRFRHNAITDRIDSNIFREIDILPLTAHLSTRMIEQAYYHPTPTINPGMKDTEEYSSPVLDSDNNKIAQMLLSKPFSSRIKGMGICTDVRNCTKDKGECLRCKYLMPQKQYLDYYLQEQDMWKQKIQKAINVGNIEYKNLCQYWIDGYDVIISRILNEQRNEIGETN